MFIAVLFLIAKEKKKTITQWQGKGQIMIYASNTIYKELKYHTSTCINLKYIKSNGGNKKWKNTKPKITNTKSQKYKP